MVTQAYRDWVAAGEPWELARPVADFRAQLVAAGVPEELIGTIGRRETHLAVDWPRDHAPFSFTGWPLPSPRWYVHALDLFHQPDLGVDLDVLVAYWLAEARAGRFPHMKYLIWRGQIYDVRDDFVPQPAEGHYDHGHLSFRTDFTHSTLGSWRAVPPGALSKGDDMANEGGKILALLLDGTSPTGTQTYGGGVPRVYLYREMAALRAVVAGLATAVDKLAEAAVSGVGMDPGVLRAAVQEAVVEGLLPLPDKVADEVADEVAERMGHDPTP